MAETTKPPKLNKSRVVRAALKKYRQKTPTEIANILTEEYKEKFTPNLVSTIKTKTRQRRAQRRTHESAEAGAPAPAPAAARQTSHRAEPAPGSVAGMVSNLQGYIEQIGKSDLQSLIDTL